MAASSIYRRHVVRNFWPGAEGRQTDDCFAHKDKAGGMTGSKLPNRALRWVRDEQWTGGETLFADIRSATWWLVKEPSAVAMSPMEKKVGFLVAYVVPSSPLSIAIGQSAEGWGPLVEFTFPTTRPPRPTKASLTLKVVCRYSNHLD